jgi:hypothetical protein
MKFFIDLQKTRYCIEHNLFPKNYFDIFHSYFYLCLLPYDLKITFLNYVNSESRKVFEDILKVKSNLYTIDECDCIVDFLPLCMNISNIDLDSLRSYLRNKKVVIFQACDNDKFFSDIENLFLFTTSGYRSKHNNNVFGCPTFNNDYYQSVILDKKLSVGFCGFIENDFRKNIVNQLLGYSYFNLIERDYWGNISTQFDYTDSHFKTISINSKREFVDNIQNNLYTLCVRGGGNYSFRLSETLMMGRIPILVDSDCILPFENEIPYKQNTVYITKENSDNFTNIDKVIQDFHSSHSEERILEIQKENRNIWLEYFKIDKSFYKTLNLLQNL